MTMKNLIRHGDVLLRRISEKPPGTYTELSDKILARGEVTGHSHSIQGEKSRVLRSSSGQLLVELEQPGQLVHEEHGKIDLEPGTYEVLRQREYDPIEERVVQD